MGIGEGIRVKNAETDATGVNKEMRIKTTLRLATFGVLFTFVTTYIIFISFTKETLNFIESKQFNQEVNAWKFNKKNKTKKYILVWNEGDAVDWEFFKEEHTTFKENQCKYDNCFVTTNRKYLGRDYRKFDAILFISNYVKNEGYRVPKRRSQEQLYIFASKDSAANHPVCDPKFDRFFNVTWTYKLDSDVPWPHFTVHDFTHKEVAPRPRVDWTKEYEPTLYEYGLITAEKDKAAIWIASNCFTNSKREALYSNLHSVLKRKKLKADSVGVCGLTQCPLDLEHDCLRDMYKYYFFFAFENSLAEDYVSEKVVKAFRNFIVPVVYGDADYNKFLPPHSYINAKTLRVENTVKLMEHLMNNTAEYLDYFRWRNHYYILQENNHVCKLCELLNKDVVQIHDNFRSWWNPKSLKSYDAIDQRIC